MGKVIFSTKFRKLGFNFFLGLLTSNLKLYLKWQILVPEQKHIVDINSDRMQDPCSFRPNFHCLALKSTN